jgi:energy-converting hydrogenase Eha subunit H
LLQNRRASKAQNFGLVALMAAMYILENRRIESAKFGLVALMALMYIPEAHHVLFEATSLWIAYAHGVSSECT